jgi:hypothetical protein
LKGNFSRAITDYMKLVIEIDRKKSKAVQEALQEGNGERKNRTLDSLNIGWILDCHNQQLQNKIQYSLSKDDNEELTYALKITAERFLSQCPAGKWRPRSPYPLVVADTLIQNENEDGREIS